jgi:signal peptidase II
MKPSPVIRLAALLVAILVLAIDQLSKQWALFALSEPGAHLHLPGPIDLTLVFNRSNAFGLAPIAGELTRWGLTGLSIGVVLILTWVLIRRPKSRPPLSHLATFGLAFIIAGAAGNALDRIQFGAVVDFIDASKVGFIWVFNLADVSLDIGVGLSILGMLSQRDKPEDQTDHTPPPVLELPPDNPNEPRFR